MLIPGCRVEEQDAMLFGTPKTAGRRKAGERDPWPRTGGTTEAPEDTRGLHFYILFKFLFLRKS